MAEIDMKKAIEENLPLPPPPEKYDNMYV